MSTEMPNRSLSTINHMRPILLYLFSTVSIYNNETTKRRIIDKCCQLTTLIIHHYAFTF